MEKRNNNEHKKIDNVLYILGLSGTVICCVYLLISKITGFRIENYLYPCLFHTVTGYYCPGCGGTRAVCAREFDTLKSKKVPQSLEIGLFFCQIFIFII